MRSRFGFWVRKIEVLLQSGFEVRRIENALHIVLCTQCTYNKSHNNVPSFFFTVRSLHAFPAQASAVRTKKKQTIMGQVCTFQQDWFCQEVP
jgi:hypothetical protein